MCALRLILPPTSPPYRDQYDEVDHRGKLEILGSCRGLILLYYDRSCDLILWNPSIGVHRISPKFKCGLTLVYLYGFGYDTSSDDYLLILIGLLDEYKYDYYDDESKDNEYKVDYQILSFNSFNETLHCLRVMGGCLSVCCSVRGCATDEIWAMKEYKVDSSWTESIVIPNNGFSPICITKDGGIIGSKEVED
ncbi:hypothetical protein D0Y65_021572 [Glycine soja]|nr:hypothetical protein D0Y65_021572 [Glycine soja]